MPSWSAYSFLFGPVMAFAGVGVLILLLRWAFRRGESVVAAPARPGAPDDYGLLVPVGTPGTYVEGEIWRRSLEDSGIRASLATTVDGPRILVWPADEERARALLRRLASG